MPRRHAAAILLLLVACGPVLAQPEADRPAVRSVEDLAAAAKPSVVVVKFSGRTGKQEGLGAGFVVSADGLVATNLHVIGEARPVTVQTADGQSYPVRSVHASDLSLDLALLKIDAKGLRPLPLGDSDKLRDGQPVVVLGHPQGLEHSVVSGVLSGREVIDGRPMLQLAVPIEKGNSGGPVLDRSGNVLGIVTLKSAVTDNLGFAMPVNALKKLIERPNPIPMSRWVTIGRLNPDEWEAVFEGQWRQRNGRVSVDGAGEGFGGRSLCLSKAKTPDLPFEVSVDVKLGDESGAAGLAWCADGRDVHYGFYPSNGKLRLSKFLGPDVFAWRVLQEFPSEHYRPGEWNTLKVRVEKGKALCYLNDRLVAESEDAELEGGRVGLVKFRATPAEFKQFRLGRELPSLRPPADVVARVEKLTARLDGRRPPAGELAKLAPSGPEGVQALREQAKLLERKAEQLRELARSAYERAVLDELAAAVAGEEGDIDLLRAALLIARLDDESLDAAAYARQVQRIASDIAESLPEGAGEAARLAALNREMFEQRGFHGSRGDYYNRANSYINQVLDDREGLPITLALLYMEVGRRLDLDLQGVALPGHFVVRHVPKEGGAYLIDVYDGGKKLTRAEAEARVRSLTGEPLREADLQPATKKAILVRMLANLSGIASGENDMPGFLRYTNATLTIDPTLAQERLRRAAIRYQSGDRDGALADIDYILDNPPDDLDREQLLRLRESLSRNRS